MSRADQNEGVERGCHYALCLDRPPHDPGDAADLNIMGFSYSMRFLPDAAASRIRFCTMNFCTNYGKNQQFLKLWPSLSTIVVNPGVAKPVRCRGDVAILCGIATGQHTSSRAASVACARPVLYRRKRIELDSDTRSGSLANDPVSTGVLGLVERLVGPAEQRRSIFARGFKRRHAHRRGNLRLGARSR